MNKNSLKSIIVENEYLDLIIYHVGTINFLYSSTPDDCNGFSLEWLKNYKYNFVIHFVINEFYMIQNLKALMWKSIHHYIQKQSIN